MRAWRFALTIALGAAMAVGGLGARACLAQSPPAPASAAVDAATRPTESDRPLLRELDRETRELYRALDGGVVRVQLPDTVWAHNAGPTRNWLVARYPRMNAEMKQQLLQNQQQQTQAPGPATGPSRDEPGNEGGLLNNNAEGPPAPGPSQPPVGPGPGGARNGVTILVPPTGGNERSPAEPASPEGAGPFAPNTIGLVIDDAGHILVPCAVDRDAVGDAPIRLIGPRAGQGADPGQGAEPALSAKLIGSDAQTGLTVLQLIRTPAKKPAPTTLPTEAPTQAAALPASHLKPVTLTRRGPADGSLVLLLSPTDASGRLAVWNDASRDSGVIVNLEGQVAGISRSGQFLGGGACQLIADQIIRNGSVRRATLGVIITQIERDDPMRATRPRLGDRPAVRVDQVVLHSVAERGGLKQGDVVLAIEGQPARDIPTLSAAIAARNGPTRLQVLRGDDLIEITVDLRQQ